MPEAVPKYRSVGDHLISRIRNGELKPGERLPGERAFAKRLDISVPTAVAAIKYLERSGIVVRRRGSGTYISPDPDLFQRRKRIGFFVSHPHLYCCRLLNQLWTFCHANNCDLVPLFRAADQLERAVAEFQLDGLLVYNQGNFSRKEVERFDSKGIPLLLLSSIQDELTDFTFGYSNADLIRDAVAYLAGLGHRRIGYLTSQADIMPNLIRHEAFLKNMWKLQLPMNPEWVRTSELTDRFLADYFASPERPTAIIIGNVSDLPQVSRALRSYGVRVPEELSVLNLDELFERKADREYSRFRIDVAGFCVQAAHYLLQILRHEQPEKPCTPNYEFVEAGTCAPPGSEKTGESL